MELINKLIAIFNLPKEQWYKVLKGAGIAGGGAALVYLGSALGLGDLASMLVNWLNSFNAPEGVVSEPMVVDGFPPWLLYPLASTLVNYLLKRLFG